MSRYDGGRFAFVPEWLLDSGVSDRGIVLYATLSLYADYETDLAWPSRRALMERLDCSRATINRGVNELLQCGAIRRSERRRYDGSQTSNSYLVVRAAPSWVRPRGITDDTPPGVMGETP